LFPRFGLFGNSKSKKISVVFPEIFCFKDLRWIYGAFTFCVEALHELLYVTCVGSYVVDEEKTHSFFN